MGAKAFQVRNDAVVNTALTVNTTFIANSSLVFANGVPLQVNGSLIANTTLLVANSSAQGVGILTASPAYPLDISATGAIRIASGNTGQRPSTANGLIRFNTDTSPPTLEFSNNTNWIATGGVSTNLAYATPTYTTGTITCDFTQNVNFTLTLNQNSTLANPTVNANTVGQSGIIVLKQDISARTLAYGNQWFFDGDTSPAIGTTVSKSNVFSWLCYDTTHFLITLVAVNSSLH